ncbi:MAG: hypothetical protein EHM58_01475 [Ignavibacteriae bacterium]|nr:MAG: hypothetical protein EHM58_01475 [Ignavibacteriota bacterium]
MKKYIIAYDIKNSHIDKTQEIKEELIFNIIIRNGKELNCPCASTLTFEMDEKKYSKLKTDYIETILINKAWYFTSQRTSGNENSDPKLSSGVKEIKTKVIQKIKEILKEKEQNNGTNSKRVRH